MRTVGYNENQEQGVDSLASWVLEGLPDPPLRTALGVLVFAVRIPELSTTVSSGLVQVGRRRLHKISIHIEQHFI